MTRPERAPKSKSTILRKVLVTTVTGGLGFALTELVLPNGEWSWMASIFLGAAAFVTQFLVDVERRLDAVEYTYRTEAGATKTLIQREFAKVTEAAELFDRMENSALPTDMVVSLMRGATQLSPEVPSLVYRLAASETTRFSTFVEELSRGGDVTYDGEDRDWMLGLTANAMHSIEAISLTTVDAGGKNFTDGGLWSSDLGRRYLEEQAKAVARGVRIQRIFVLDRADLAPSGDFLDVCRTHEAAGIEVRVLDPEASAHAGALIDFIVFDRVITYETTPASQRAGANPLIVNTRLVLNQKRTANRIRQFCDLWADGHPVETHAVGGAVSAPPTTADR